MSNSKARALANLAGGGGGGVSEQYVSGEISAHNADTTDVHGIADTSALVLTNDARLSDTRTPTDNSVTSSKIVDGTIVDGDINASASIAFTKLASSAGLSVIGRGANTTGTVAAITAANDGEVLRRSGTTVGFGTISTAGIADSAVTSAKIADGTIVNADISASAAIAPSKISGTAVITTDSRLSNDRYPTAHAASHASGGSDAITVAQSQVTNLTTDLAAKANALVSLVSQTGSYTLVLADAGKVLTVDSATAATVTVPPNSSVAFPVGTKIDVIQTGAGETTIAAGSGVTINSEGGKLKINAQWQAVSLLKSATDAWVLIGALA